MIFSVDFEHGPEHDEAVRRTSEVLRTGAHAHTDDDMTLGRMEFAEFVKWSMSGDRQRTATVISVLIDAALHIAWCGAIAAEHEVTGSNPDYQRAAERRGEIVRGAIRLMADRDEP